MGEGSHAPPVVLIVDDNRTLANLLALLLSTQLRAVVHKAHRCDEARRIAAAASLDVIVTDVYLPDGDGLSLAEEIRAAQPELRLLLMSAELPQDALLRAKSTFVFASALTKPFDSQEMVASLRAALAGARKDDEQRRRVPGEPAVSAGELESELEGIEVGIAGLMTDIRRCADDEDAIRALVKGPLEELLGKVFRVSSSLRPRIGR